MKIYGSPHVPGVGHEWAFFYNKDDADKVFDFVYIIGFFFIHLNTTILYEQILQPLFLSLVSDCLRKTSCLDQDWVLQELLVAF